MAYRPVSMAAKLEGLLTKSARNQNKKNNSCTETTVISCLTLQN